MKVTEQRNGKSLQASGPALKGDFPAHDSGTIWLDQSGVYSEGSHSSGRRELNKFPSRGKKRQSVSSPLNGANLLRERFSIQDIAKQGFRDTAEAAT
jgi:hypothetical protein